MKKFLIAIAPLCAILFVAMCILWELKGALVFFGVALFVVVVSVLQGKWMDFIDKHVKD